MTRKQLIKHLNSLGVEVITGKSNHLKAYYNGRLITTFANSPSDVNSHKNGMKYINRAIAN